MLRITTIESGDEQKWILDGQLAGPFVAELKSSWDGSERTGKSVVDLTGVTFIDDAGAAMLWAMEQAGVRFIARGVDTTHLLEELKRETTPHLRRCLSWMSCRKQKAGGKDEADQR